MNRYSLLEKVKKTITKYSMLNKGDRVVVAVSGGPDSVALLYLLEEIKKEYDLKLFIAHLNHKLRGKESDYDQEFVFNLASKLGLKFYSKSFNVKKLAKKKRLSLEEGARVARYDYLNQVASKVKAQKIALGHTADDQAETVLMRLLRGSGSLGLSGIPPKGDKLIRPLIEVKREEVEGFLKGGKIKFRTDSSNLRPDFLRNKLRLKLLPLIEREYNPKIKKVLGRTSYLLSEEEKYLKKKALELFKKSLIEKNETEIILDLENFFDYDKSLKRIIIRICLERLEGSLKKIGFEPAERLLNLVEKGKTGKKIDFGKGLSSYVSKDYLCFYKNKKKKKHSFVFHPPGEKNLKSSGLKVKSQILEFFSLDDIEKNKDPYQAHLDLDKLKFPLRLRSRKDGDWFKPLGMKGKKNLSDFLIDKKIPSYKRDDVLLLVSDKKIAWVIGHRISEDFKVTEKTKKVLKIKVTKDGKDRVEKDNSSMEGKK